MKTPPAKRAENLNRKTAGEQRARELWVRRTEAEYEAEMDERIRVIGAEIKSTNLELMRDSDCAPRLVLRDVRTHTLPESE